MKYEIVISVERVVVEGPLGEDEPLLQYDLRVPCVGRDELVAFLRNMAANSADPALRKYIREVEAAARKIERKDRADGQ